MIFSNHMRCCQENVLNLMNQCFPNELNLILERHTQTEDPFRMQDRPMERENSIDMFSGATLQLTFKKLPL